MTSSESSRNSELENRKLELDPNLELEPKTPDLLPTSDFRFSTLFDRYLESKGYRYEGNYTVWEPRDPSELEADLEAREAEEEYFKAYGIDPRISTLDDFDTSLDCEEMYTTDYCEEF